MCRVASQLLAPQALIPALMAARLARALQVHVPKQHPSTICFSASCAVLARWLGGRAILTANRNPSHRKEHRLGKPYISLSN